MRRSDRAVNTLAEQCLILDHCPIARIGFSEVGANIANTADVPKVMAYIVPMHFAYTVEDGALRLYFHCANEGRKLDLLIANPRVCFEADRLLETVPSDKACAWSAHYESVMGEGLLEMLTEPTEKIAALDLLMKRYGYTGAPIYDEAALKAVTALRLTVTQITGKRA